jgi:hypothetical protein
MRGASNSRTICEVLREINDIHQGRSVTDERTRHLLAEAEAMAKKMSAKMLEYNREAFADFWEANPDVLRDTEARMKKSYIAVENPEWVRLRKYADTVPSLGSGGITCRDELIRYASEVKPLGNIIEFGPFLGSASAYIMLGIMRNQRVGITLYSVDPWVVDETYSGRAKRFCDVDMPVGADMQDYYREYMRPLHDSPMRTFEHVMEKRGLMEFRWPCGSVDMVVDDIGSGKDSTDYYMRLLSPHFIPRETVVFMMDYFFYETHEGGVRSYQKRFIERNAHAFKYIGRPHKSRCAIFKYLGGEIDYGVEE